MAQTYCWQHWDDPTTINRARVDFSGDGLLADGEQRAPGYRASWRLDASTGWVTHLLRVDVVAEEWWRSLVLERDPATGEWSAQTRTQGSPPAELNDPGPADPGMLSGAVDCDLGLCPLTNTMPIRRLSLLREDVPRTPLLMAWVDMPSLDVIPSDQYYASHSSTSVRYVSGTREVDVLLGVDQDGVVTDYPDLARRVAEQPWGS